MIGALGRAWQKPRGFLWDVAPTLVYFGVLFWAGLSPLKSLPGPDFELLDKAWHLVAFAGLTGLLARSLAHVGRPPASAVRDAALAASFLGAALEVLQSLTSYRSADWKDWVADSLGAGLAYGTLRWLQSAAAAPSGAE